MKRFVESEDRSRSTLFPVWLDDYVDANNPACVVDVFVDGVRKLNDMAFGHTTVTCSSVRGFPYL